MLRNTDVLTLPIAQNGEEGRQAWPAASIAGPGVAITSAGWITCVTDAVPHISLARRPVARVHIQCVVHPTQFL
jgi:hypothetical protein